jgi:hypothetical protein
MDQIQRYIANADDRPADGVERADAALAALASQHLSAGKATEVYIYTTDIAAPHENTLFRETREQFINLPAARTTEKWFVSGPAVETEGEHRSLCQADH